MPSYFSPDGNIKPEPTTVMVTCGHCDGNPKTLRRFLYKHIIWYSLPKFELCDCCNGTGEVEEELTEEELKEFYLDN